MLTVSIKTKETHSLQWKLGTKFKTFVKKRKNSFLKFVKFSFERGPRMMAFLWTPVVAFVVKSSPSTIYILTLMPFLAESLNLIWLNCTGVKHSKVAEIVTTFQNSFCQEIWQFFMLKAKWGRCYKSFFSLHSSSSKIVKYISSLI